MASSCPTSPFEGDADHEPRQARSAPLPKEVFTVSSQGPLLDAAGLGVACALMALMRGWELPGWLPALLNERSVPLCEKFAPIPSFLFTGTHHTLGPVLQLVVRPCPS